MTLYADAAADRLIIMRMLFVKTLHMTLWGCYDVRQMTVNIVLFSEIQCKKMDIFML